MLYDTNPTFERAASWASAQVDRLTLDGMYRMALEHNLLPGSELDKALIDGHSDALVDACLDHLSSVYWELFS